MLLNVDQLQKQLDKDEFQEDGSMTAFWGWKGTRHQRQYERRVNKRQMQMQESKIDTGKALDADLVDTESIRTDSTVQDDSSRSGNDTDADDADIRPIYDEGQWLRSSLELNVKRRLNKTVQALHHNDNRRHQADEIVTQSNELEGGYSGLLLTNISMEENQDKRMVYAAAYSSGIWIP
ncbi:hypothetical protein Tco_0053456 [Tanacetum coccineum]